MATYISPLAQIDPRACIGRDVYIGPFCLVGPDVSLGDGCRLESHVVLVGHTTIGQRNRFWANTVIGGEPQDKTYHNSNTRVVIGDDHVGPFGADLIGSDDADLAVVVRDRFTA